MKRNKKSHNVTILIAKSYENKHKQFPISRWYLLLKYSESYPHDVSCDRNMFRVL